MPFTPFHFGPGALVHAAAPRRVSLTAFCAANVLTDFETLWFIVTRDPPLHRFLHTFLGAAVAAAATVALFAGARRLRPVVKLRDGFGGSELAPVPVLLGAAIGTSSHVVLDSLMHQDIRPFAPFSDANPMLGAVPLGQLHVGCIAAGVAGLALLGVREAHRRWRMRL